MYPISTFKLKTSFSQLPSKIAKAVKSQTTDSSLISMNFWKVSRESFLFYSKILSFEIILIASFPGYWPPFNHKWVYRGKQCRGKKEHFYTQMSGKTVRWKRSTKNKFQKVWEFEVNPGGLAHAHGLCLSQTWGCGLPAARGRMKLE